MSNGVRYYLIFVTLLWNAVEALTMYLLLVQVFHADISRYALKTGLVAWGQYTRCLGSVHSLLGVSGHSLLGVSTLVAGAQYTRCLGSVHSLLGASTLVAWVQYSSVQLLGASGLSLLNNVISILHGCCLITFQHTHAFLTQACRSAWWACVWRSTEKLSTGSL